jgi:hypothetical protein
LNPVLPNKDSSVANRPVEPGKNRTDAIHPMATAAARWRGVTSGLAWDAAALTVFVIGALVYLHPLVAGGFTNFSIGANESNDPQIFIWGLAWYPYALTHGLDPFYTTLAFAPTGYNLAWSTTIAAPALALWPITRHFGPLVSFNLLCVLVPILSAYAAYALCRQISKAPLPSIVGGLVYGFSTYQRIEADHLNLGLSFIPPLLVLLFLLRMEGRIGALRFDCLLAGSLVCQFLISPEIFVTSMLFGAAAISLGAWLGDRSLRTRLRTPVRDSINAIAAALVVLSPYLYRFIPSPFGLSPIYNPAHCSSDLLGFLLPTEASLSGHLKVARLLGSRIGFGCEPAAYMGLLPLITIWSALQPRTPATATAFPVERFLALLLAGMIVFSLGPIVHVGGTAVAPSIWLPALIIPIVNNALPARFVLYAFLALSVITTLWLNDARRHAAARWILAAAAIASVVPAAVPAANASLPFFNQRMYRHYLAAGETVMFLPFGYNGEAMKWQAQSGFFFRVAGGYLSVIPHEYAAWPIVTAMLAEQPYIPGFGDQFKAFIATHGVAAVIIPESEYAPYAKLCATLAVAPVRAGGAIIFRPSPASLAPFDPATAAEMDTRYNFERFETLLNAARDYLARGYPAANLSPSAAVRLGLLDAAIAGDPARAQTTGFPFTGAARRSAAFQAVARFLISHRMIRERLAVELGPVPPADDATTSGIWLGPWSDGSIAVGVVAGPRAAASLRSRFGAGADAIYYPYPLPYAAQLDSAQSSRVSSRRSLQPSSVPDSQMSPQMFLMTFKPAALPAAQ